MATGTLAPEPTRVPPRDNPLPLPQRVARALFAPVDIGMVAFFRIAFGVIMAWEAYRYLSYDWIGRNYIDPDFHFTFFGFSWVKTWPGNGMVILFWVMGVLAACIAAGLFYRVTTVLFFFTFAQIFLCEQAYYLNHFYLITLISLLMCFLPAHRAWSLDVLRKPSLYTPVVPAWTLWLLRFQIAVAYFYGGIAKINPDWLQGEPMRQVLAEKVHNFPLIGQWFGEEWMVWGFTYGGLLFDLLVVPALLWKRTRLAAYVAALVFNLTNSILFEIGIFPWFMVCATILFFPPEWLSVEGTKPEGSDQVAEPPNATTAAAASESALRTPHSTPNATQSPLTSRQKLTLALLAAWVAVQVLVPFRHLLYPGDVSWTEEGHLFAWHMKLRRKAGEIHFYAVTPDGRRLPEAELLKHADSRAVKKILARLEPPLANPREQKNPGDYVYISTRQRKKMSGRPDMILQYAHFLADRFREHGYGDVAIYCESAISLNGRAPQPLIDPQANLAAVRASLRPASWIVPLSQPLPKPGEQPFRGDAEDVE